MSSADGSSTAGEAAPASGSKRRRVSASRAAGALAVVQEKLKADQAEKDLQDIVGQLRGKPDLISAVKAFLASGLSRTGPVCEHFPRCVRTIETVPDKDKLQLLVRLGFDRAGLINMANSKDNISKLFFMAVGQPKGWLIGTRVKNDFFASVEMSYNRRQRPLEGTDLANVDWTISLGYWKLVVDNDSSIRNILHKPTNTTKVLPMAMIIPLSDLPQWRIDDNWFEAISCLTNESLGLRFTLWTYFGFQSGVPAVADAPAVAPPDRAAESGAAPSGVVPPPPLGDGSEAVGIVEPEF